MRADFAWWRVALAVVCLGWPSLLSGGVASAQAPSSGAKTSFGVRLEWGGGGPRRWQGTVSIVGPVTSLAGTSEVVGTVSAPRSLGIEADEPGSMWLNDGRLRIAAASNRVYDGVDLELTAPLDSSLKVTLRAAEPRAATSITTEDDAEFSATIPLRQLLDDYYNANIDATGNRLLVRRAPGDRLRVSTDRAALVFAPGETWRLTVEPRHLTAASPATRYRLQAYLAGPTTRGLWSDEREFLVGQPTGPIAAQTFDVRVPEQEGVYDLVITAGRRTLSDRLGLRATIDERRVQLVVVAAERPAAAPAAQLELLTEIDPSHPSRLDRLASLPANLPLVPGLRRGPFGSHELATRPHPLGPLAELAPEAREPNIAWEAFPLPVGRPGQPHLLEVEYASDLPQALGISIVEPNAAGAVLPIGLDSGFYLAADTVEPGPAQWRRHRLVFWPRTHAPLALLTNRQPGTRATFGKLRLLGPKTSTLANWTNLSREIPGLGRELPGLARENPLETRLPRAVPIGSPAAERLLTAYFDRPLVAENFNADQALDASTSTTGRTLDDWHTFYQAGARLTDYLQYVGYGGAVVSVWADGSTIYPSELLAPTPRYDDGAFFATGQDPVRKDVLDLWLRQFEREQLMLIPALQFSAPLAELEELRRAGGSPAVGLELIGRTGQTWRAEQRPRQELAPYYNVLHPRVQEAMLAVVRELIDRYGRRRAFGGLALQLAADGYAQLPGAEWGYDDDTLARFERETRVDLGPSGPETFARRVSLVEGRYRQSWLEWRAQAVARFHARIATLITAARPGARLYLVTSDLLQRPELEALARPALSHATNADDLLLSVGLQPALYREHPEIVLLRATRHAPLDNLAAAGSRLELNESAELDAALRSPGFPGAVFFHERQEARLPSFDAKSPFRTTRLRLVAQPAPVGLATRQRFAHALATLDAQMICDGGWLLPLGAEDELRDWLNVYRQLPAGPFVEVPGNSRPVTFRTLARGDRTIVYAVNDSAYKVTAVAKLTTPANVKLAPLPGSRRAFSLTTDGESSLLNVELAPYELVAATILSPTASLREARVSFAASAEQEIDARINNLWERAAALKDPHFVNTLANPGFETGAERAGEIAGWTLRSREGVVASLDTTQPHGGARSLRLTTSSTAAEFASNPVIQPATGRLSVSAWLRVADASRQPTVRIGIRGVDGARDYQRFAEIGAGQPGQELTARWSQFVFPVTDLPTPETGRFQVWLELTGRGEVWVDDVELMDLDFSDVERLELSKLISLVQYKRQQNEWGDCLHMLAGYWPRFLTAHVQPLDNPRSVPVRPEEPAPPKPTAPIQEADRRSGLMDRLRNALPSWTR